MQTGWFKEVHVKDIDSHSVRALLASRALLVKIKRDLENHVRGLLKNLGLVIGRAKFNVFAVRAEELIEGRPELIAAIRPLLEARSAVEQQVSELDDLSPKVHPARGGILFSFEPVWLGDATGRDAEPSTQRSVPSCCIADAVSLA